jgi:hypothetical protein
MIFVDTTALVALVDPSDALHARAKKDLDRVACHKLLVCEPVLTEARAGGGTATDEGPEPTEPAPAEPAPAEPDEPSEPEDPEEPVAPETDAPRRFGPALPEPFLPETD